MASKKFDYINYPFVQSTSKNRHSEWNYLHQKASNCSRTNTRHPEVYLEASATIYKNFAIHLMTVLDYRTTEKPDFTGTVIDKEQLKQYYVYNNF